MAEVAYGSITKAPQTLARETWNNLGGNTKAIAKALGVERCGLSVWASQQRAKGVDLVKGQKGRPLGSGDPNKQGASKRRAEKSAAVSELLGAIDADFEGLILESEVSPPVAVVVDTPVETAPKQNKKRSKKAS